MLDKIFWLGLALSIVISGNGYSMNRAAKLVGHNAYRIAQKNSLVSPVCLAKLAVFSGQPKSILTQNFSTVSKDSEIAKREAWFKLQKKIESIKTAAQYADFLHSRLNVGSDISYQTYAASLIILSGDVRALSSFKGALECVSAEDKIFMAVLSGNVKMLEFCHEEHSLVYGLAGLTPLHVATKLEQVEMVKKLMDMGYKSYDRDNDGHTPEDYAQCIATSTGNLTLVNLFRLQRTHDELNEIAKKYRPGKDY